MNDCTLPSGWRRARKTEVDLAAREQETDRVAALDGQVQALHLVHGRPSETTGSGA